MWILSVIAEALGASEAALKLLLTILAGYPLAAIYHKFIVNKEHIYHHLYFALSGIILCYFNYGNDLFHSLISILITYVWSHVAYNSRYLVAGNFIFHMVYLLIGYYYTESETYDIKWTMPQCVLTLRLIGFIFDISDGKLPDDKLSKDQKETALKEIPSLIELLGFSYFPSSFIVGPQYPFTRYRKFLNKEFSMYKNSTQYGLSRLYIGLIYLVIRQIGTKYLPEDYLLTDEYKNFIFIKKLILLGIWAKLVLYKYIACWLLTEGALVCFGLTFLKVTENNEEDWSGCTNVNLYIFETASKLGCYVHSFNVNTNAWLAQYVYKRLKFLGNRMISQAAALLFLAIWHGFHSGYYISFLFEFLFITFERQLQIVYDKYTVNYQQFLQINYINTLILLIRQIYTVIFLGWCLVPFVFFNYKNYINAFSTLNYVGVIFLSSWFLINFLHTKYIRMKKIKLTTTISNNIKEDSKEKNQ